MMTLNYNSQWHSWTLYRNLTRGFSFFCTLWSVAMDLRKFPRMSMFGIYVIKLVLGMVWHVENIFVEFINTNIFPVNYFN